MFGITVDQMNAGIAGLGEKHAKHDDLEQNMLDTSTSSGSVDIDPAETTTRNMVALGKKRSRGRRVIKLVIALLALGIAAAIFGNIYSKTIEPGFEWRWFE